MTEEPVDSPAAEEQATDDPNGEVPPEPGSTPDDRDLPDDNTDAGDPDAAEETDTEEG